MVYSKNTYLERMILFVFNNFKMFGILVKIWILKINIP